MVMYFTFVIVLKYSLPFSSSLIILQFCRASLAAKHTRTKSSVERFSNSMTGEKNGLPQSQRGQKDLNLILGDVPKYIQQNFKSPPENPETSLMVLIFSRWLEKEKNLLSGKHGSLLSDNSTLEEHSAAQNQEHRQNIKLIYF